MNIRFDRKTVVIMAGLAVLVFALAAVLAFAINGKLVVALYGLDEREAETMRNLAGTGPRSTVVQQSDPRRAAKADIIVTRSGLASLSLAKMPAAMPPDIMARTVPSLRRAVEINGIPLAMPILLDHFELAWHRDRLSSVGMENLPTMAEVERAMALWTVRRQKSTNAIEKSSYAFAFAGGDDEALLLLLSSLCLSEGGLSAYKAVAGSIMAGTPLDTLAGMAIGTSSNGGILTFGAVLDRVVSWYKAGYLHPEWYAFRNKDIKALFESDAIFMSAQLLSFHRTVEYKSITRFDTGRFPSSSAVSDRALVAPLTIAIVSARAHRRLGSMEIVRSMTDPATAREAASVSGRSTTIAAAAAPDIQAADALSYAAASFTVVAGWYRDAFEDDAAAGRFAAGVRERLRR